MKLVIGGCSQGKLHYVLNKKTVENYIVLDGMLCSDDERQEKTVIINHFHNWVRECLIKGGYPEKEIFAFVEKHPECIIISDEIGNGIIPTDSFEREYRERTGRILVDLASRAGEVVRVICGIGQKIK